GADEALDAGELGPRPSDDHARRERRDSDDDQGNCTGQDATPPRDGRADRAQARTETAASVSASSCVALRPLPVPASGSLCVTSRKVRDERADPHRMTVVDLIIAVF